MSIKSDYESGLRRQQTGDKRFAKKMATLARKSAAGRVIKTRKKSAGATRGVGTWKTKNTIPALILKIHGGNLASDAYAEKNGQLLETNMLGLTAKERWLEWLLDTARAPRINPKNLFLHVSLSRPEAQPLTAEQWRQVAQIFLAEIGAQGCQFVLQRHSNTKNDHVHLTFSRVKPDGSLVTTSQNFWRWRDAVRRVETQIGLTSTASSSSSPSPSHSQSDRQVNQARRAERLGLNPNHIDPNILNRALACSATPVDFVRQ